MARVGEALLLLARTFESQGAVLEVLLTFSCPPSCCYAYQGSESETMPDVQAIKCHTALCSGGKQLPSIEVQSQIALARLLIAHTHNVHEARQRLERAVCSLPLFVRGLILYTTSTEPTGWADMWFAIFRDWYSSPHTK